MGRVVIRSLLPIVILAVAVFAFHATTLRTGHIWGDSAHYIGHARNLVEGESYGDTGYLFDPAAPEIGPQNYPPATAFMLAPVIAACGADFEALKLLMSACLAVAIAFLALGFQRSCGRLGAGLLMAALALNPLIWGQKDQVSSDAPFLLWCYAALLTADSLLEAKSPRWRQAFLCGLLMAIAFATRGVGIVLFPAVLVTALMRHRGLPRRDVVAALVVFLAGVLGLKAFMPSGGGYADRFYFSGEQMAANVVSYAKYAAVPFEGAYPVEFSAVVAAFVYGLALFGLATSVRRGPHVRDVFACGYVALIVLWPGNQGARFLLPVVPIAMGWSLMGCRALEERFGRRVGKGLLVGLCSLLLGTSLSALMTADMEPWPDGVTSAPAREFFQHVTHETPQDAVFLFRKPRALATYTERDASGWADGATPEVLLDRARAVGATYFAAGPFSDDLVEDTASEFPAHLTPTWTNGVFTVFRLTSHDSSR